MIPHPFQCIAVVDRFFLAACGPRLHCLDLSTYTVVWGCTFQAQPPLTAATPQDNHTPEDLDQPPAKKQKLQGRDGTPGDQDPDQPPAQNQTFHVTKLVVSPNHQYVLVITDDKCVHVLQHTEGTLTPSSSRLMPKRPCAVQILPDNATILLADKFGDVYSLPLVPTATPDAAADDIAPQIQPQFKPSADPTTIHSQRNLEVLAAQLKQRIFTKKKDPIKFEHEVLIGHTSMLTDMKYVCEAKVPRHGYIITADRDEHIRVSRAPPQAYITEGWCFGHREFVSKICQIGGSPLLVSGGGDEWLGVWNWKSCKLKSKVNLRDLVPSAGEKITVSGIWSIDVKVGHLIDPVVVVALERIPTLIFGFHETVGRGNADDATTSPMRWKTVTLPHPPIDLVWGHEPEGYGLVVSLDNRTQGSDTDTDTDQFAFLKVERHTAADCSAIHIERRMLHTAAQNALTRTLHSSQQPPIEANHQHLDALLYSLSGLRKRRDEANGEAEGAEKPNMTPSFVTEDNC